jgi:hypothetical protein
MSETGATGATGDERLREVVREVVGQLRDGDAPATFTQAVALVGPERVTGLLRARGLEYDAVVRSTVVAEAFDDAMRRRRDRGAPG